MRIKKIAVLGFRGFNHQRELMIHPRLTLICAPNSYGKTSISEAFEWLLYGITSKVENADSKDEYKGSLRNRHLEESSNPIVSVVFNHDGADIEYSAELLADERSKKFVDGVETEKWPLPADISQIPKPFILQHALKNLLLATPDERFQGFAHLLGLGSLERFQKNIVSLCTKPDSAIPSEVSQLRKNVNALVARLESHSSLVSISKQLKKDGKSLDDIYKTIIDECMKRVPTGTPEANVLPQMLRIRDDARSKIFDGHLKLQDFSPREKQIRSDDEDFILSCITDSLVHDYASLVSLETVQHISERAEFFGLGTQFLGKAKKCPFCGQIVTKNARKHIHDSHHEAIKANDQNASLKEVRKKLAKSFAQLRIRLNDYHELHIGKVSPLLAIESALPKLKSILAPKHQTHFDQTMIILTKISKEKEKLEKNHEQTVSVLAEVEKSLDSSIRDSRLVKSLGEAIVKYVSGAQSFSKLINASSGSISEAEKVLRYELDTLAGTEDLGVLMDLLESWSNFVKKLEIDVILEGLKDLRKTVDQKVAAKMLEAISGELTTEVMNWYGLLKTTGDPNIHFSGFDLERTTKGELKARRLQIKAASYDKDLVSAVSSLSESKLNALGLCVNIATNMKGESPFEFLIIDDPIQSWDAEHEIQFIEVIQKLVLAGKQVILLSHNQQWIKQVRSGCRSLNGWFYEINGYAEDGPHIQEVPWEGWRQRLQEVDAVLKSTSAGNIDLQRAEEEIRIVIEDLSSELYLKRIGTQKHFHKMNSAEARKILVECGVEVTLVDRIAQTFVTTDPAHHADADYSAHRERIRRYHSWAHELGAVVY